MGWWTDRNEKTHLYWAGNGGDETANDKGSLCQCGLDENCLNETLKYVKTFEL